MSGSGPLVKVVKSVLIPLLLLFSNADLNAANSERRLQVLQGLIPQVLAASESYGIPSWLIVGVLADEVERAGLEDGPLFQGHDMDEYIRIVLDPRLDEPERKTSLTALVKHVETFYGKSMGSISFGLAQMQPTVVGSLISAGYLAKPDLPSHPYKNDLFHHLYMLSKNEWAPVLVAARLKQICDHWLKSAENVDLTKNWAVVASLYSIGLEGRKGVTKNPIPSQRGARIVQRQREWQELIENAPR